ncbi:heparinase II/III family protein [Plantibacter sp. VKM Ac-2880]|uniref:heparinase II/III domain-containing protein n=1 Tax=Plantibacter sp. VKM Ac-2880 TaxID=2783827 RepID=UPI001890A4E4|nr:heparinase II/III family protein [Plantibacter sp. VKM Ac-2880]MBF4567350.1 heparinase II/III family protein [Plantibacter sp. VKM Ac-2880]
MTTVTRARGGWWHDFVCPTHGTELLEARGDAFVCTYGCELRGEPYASAWMVLEHQVAARLARTAARRFRRHGDPADQAQALAVVREFADYSAEITAEWNRDSESWMLQGKLFKQALTEAIWATQIADAVVVLAEDEAAREAMGAPVATMLEALLETIVESRRVLVIERDDLTSNYVAWLDAAGGLATLALAALGGVAPHGDQARWIEQAVEHSAVALGQDGWEWEGSTYYHLFVLRAYLLTLAGADQAALDPALVGRLRRMVDVLVGFAGPDGRLPMLHDGPYDRLGVHLEVLEICVLAGQLWDRTGLDTVEAWARRRIGERHDGLEDLLDGWFSGTPLPAPGDVLDRGSVLFADVGYAVVRSEASSLLAVLDAGPHGGSHGHLDTLALYLYGDGVAWQPAPGVPPYGSALRRGHYARTTAHPTVRADDADQLESSARVERWEVDPATDTTLVQASSDAAIDGVLLERRVESIGGILVDVVRATTDDGSARSFTAAFRPAVPFEVVQQSDGWRTGWSGPAGRRLHGHHVADVASVLVDAPGRGPSDDPTVPLAVGDWTATAPRVTFVSVFAEGEVSPIASVGLDAGRLVIALTDGRTLERELLP